MKEKGFDQISIFEPNKELYPSSLLDMFEHISIGKPLRSHVEIYSFISKYLKQVDPTIKDYSSSIPTTDCLARAIIHEHSVKNNKLTITNHSPLGISINQTFLNNLINTNSKNEQFQSLLKLSSCFFHELKHISDFKFALEDVSTFSYNLISSHIAGISHGIENYNNTYFESFVENNAYSAQHLTQLNLCESLLKKEFSDEFVEIIKNFMQESKINLYKDYLNELTPTKLNGKFSHKSIVNAKKCKPIIENSPDLLSQYKILSLKYDNQGKEKSLSTLISEKQTLTETTQINQLYSQLIFEKLALSNNSEIFEFINSANPTDIKAVADLACSFVYGEIEKENTIINHVSKSVAHLLKQNLTQDQTASLLTVFSLTKATEYNCNQSQAEMLSILENYQNLAGLTNEQNLT